MSLSKRSRASFTAVLTFLLLVLTFLLLVLSFLMLLMSRLIEDDVSILNEPGTHLRPHRTFDKPCFVFVKPTITVGNSKTGSNCPCLSFESIFEVSVIGKPDTHDGIPTTA
jgi:hypothetical protein